MKYPVVLEYDDKSGHYAATVPGLPIFVDAMSEKEARKIIKEAIEFYLDECSKGRHERPLSVKVITVDV